MLYKNSDGTRLRAVDADAAEIAFEVVLRVPNPRALRADDEMRLIFDTAILEQASH